ncbi:MAG TPA: class I SAM-dependent methyltransferase, partial [Chloroflexota bacterium]
TCRLCSSPDLQVALPLVPTPMGDKYVPYERRHEVVDELPLDINICGNCGHLQTSVVANPIVLYKHYLSRPAAVNAGLSDLFRSYCEDLLERFIPKDGGFAVELGSNDGIFSRFLQDRGVKTLGVEPALNLAEQATQAGVRTIPDFFSSELAGRIRAEDGPANVVVANHMLANVDDADDFMKGVRGLLAPEGIFAMQTFYMRDVLQKKLLENFNHEHLSYFYVRSLSLFFERHGMQLFDVQHVPAKGGSIRLFAQLKGGSRAVKPVVHEMIAEEERLGMPHAETYAEIKDFIAGTREQLQRLLGPCRTSGQTVAAYGTSIGATTFTYQYGLGDLIQFYVDDDSYRQNLVSPGLHIPVVAPNALLERKPEYVIMLAPLYADQIIAKNEAYLDQGGTFVLIWPEFAIRQKVAV